MHRSQRISVIPWAAKQHHQYKSRASTWHTFRVLPGTMAPPNLQLALLHMDSIWPVCFPLEQLQGSQHRSTVINISNCFTGLHCFEESLSWWILIIHAVITCNYFMSWSARSAALHDRCKCQGTFRSMTQMSGSAVRPALSARADSKADARFTAFSKIDKRFRKV